MMSMTRARSLHGLKNKIKFHNHSQTQCSKRSLQNLNIAPKIRSRTICVTKVCFSADANSPLHSINDEPMRLRDRLARFESDNDPRQQIIDTAFEEKQTADHSTTSSSRYSKPSTSIVGIHGWTTESLSIAAEKCGYPGVAHGMFPDGPLVLVEQFIEKANKQMVLELETVDLEHMTLRDKVKTIIKTRLQLIGPYVHNWSQALAILSHPTNLPRALQQAAVIADEIAYLSGDRSTDFNWYTKRTLIGGVYAATELHMLSDASVGFNDTWSFLERRIDDIVYLSRTANEAEKVLTTIGKGVFSVVNDGVSNPQQIASTLYSGLNQFIGHISTVANAASAASKHFTQQPQQHYTPPTTTHVNSVVSDPTTTEISTEVMSTEVSPVAPNPTAVVKPKKEYPNYIITP